MGQSHENMSDHIKLSIGDGYAELQTSRLNCIRENANIPSFFLFFCGQLSPRNKLLLLKAFLCEVHDQVPTYMQQITLRENSTGLEIFKKAKRSGAANL